MCTHTSHTFTHVHTHTHTIMYACRYVCTHACIGWGELDQFHAISHKLVVNLLLNVEQEDLPRHVTETSDFEHWRQQFSWLLNILKVKFNSVFAAQNFPYSYILNYPPDPHTQLPHPSPFSRICPHLQVFLHSWWRFTNSCLESLWIWQWVPILPTLLITLRPKYSPNSPDWPQSYTVVTV